MNSNFNKKDLIIFVAHIDDAEFCTYGYLFKHYKEYEKIKIITATSWHKKIPIWNENKKKLPKKILDKIVDINLNFEQKKIFKNLDEVKDSFFCHIDFDKRFDLLVHDEHDCHTDHVALNLISKGIYKYCNRYITIHSPSSVNFQGNYYIPLSKKIFKLKSESLARYDIKKDQSYTGTGYYLYNKEYSNIARSYVLQNFTFYDYDLYEIYKIIKWI